MKELFSRMPDTPTPLNTSGGYDVAAGSFQLKRSLKREPKSREDLDQPKRELIGQNQPKNTRTTNSTDRYFGAFSIESHRHVWDLLQKHPTFDDKPTIRMNRVGNNTRDVLPNDPIKTVENGGKITYQ